MRDWWSRLAEHWRAMLRPTVMLRLAGGNRHDPIVDLLLRDAPNACLVVDAAGRVVMVNAALVQLVAPGTDISPGADAALLFDQASRGTIWQKVVHMLRGHGTALRLARACLAGGNTHVTVAADPISADGGVVDGVLIRFTDITLQAVLEGQLVQSQKQQALGQFAAGIAHDFNNLLTAVMGAADAIATRPAVDPETIEEAGQIQNGAERGAALVRQLLAFGGQPSFRPRGLAVNAAITSLAGMLRRLLGVTIRLDLDLEHPGRAIWIDPTQLDQVMVNLAVNSRDAMPDGGVLTLRSGHLTLYRERSSGADVIPPGRYVTIDVGDTGTGIAPDVLPRIFDPLFTTKRDQNGTGLGLSTVSGIVRQAGGYLTVETAPGQGTRFRIYFPGWEGAADVPAEPCVPSESTNSVMPGYVLLLVEDEDPVRRLTARSFELRGWTVLAAESGEAALEVIEGQDRPITAIVSDLVMPGMDGVSLVRAVRARPGHATVPAVLVSGYAEEILRRKIGDDSTSFLSKPYLPRDLVGRVEAVLSGAVPPAV